MRRSSAAIGSLVFALGAPFADRVVGQLNVFDSLAWVPLALALAVKAIRSGQAGWAAGSALCLAVSLSAGHTDPPLIGLMAVTILYLTAWRWPLAPGDHPLGIAKAGLQFLVVVVLFAGFAAPQVLVMHAYAQEAVRWVGVASPIPGTANVSQAILAVNPHLSPYTLGSFAFAHVLAPPDTSPFLGSVVLVLAGAGALSGRRGISPWLAMTVIGILLAFGTETPVLPALVHLVPAISQFREPARYLWLVAVGAPVLVAAAVDSVAGLHAPRLAHPVAALGVGGALALAATATALWLTIGPGPSALAVGISLVMAGAAAAILASPQKQIRVWAPLVILVLVATQLGPAFNDSLAATAGGPDRPIVTAWNNPDLVAVTGYLRGALAAEGSQGQRVLVLTSDVPRNWGAVDAIPTTTSYSATLPSRFFLLSERLPPIPTNPGSHLLSVAYAVAGPGQVLALPVVARSGELTVYKAGPEPPAWFVPGQCQVPSASDGADVIARNPSIVSSVAVVEVGRSRIGTKPPLLGCLQASASAPQRSSVSVQQWSDGGDISVHVTSSTSGFLVVSTNWSRGWHATLDGHRSLATRPTDVDLVGIQVPAGSHVVRLEFWPPGLGSGLVILVCTVAVAAAWPLALLVRRQRSRRGDVS